MNWPRGLGQVARNSERGIRTKILVRINVLAMTEELVTASGRTNLSSPLQPHDIREVSDDVLVAVRPAGSAPTQRDA